MIGYHEGCPINKPHVSPCDFGLEVQVHLQYKKGMHTTTEIPSMLANVEIQMCKEISQSCTTQHLCLDSFIHCRHLPPAAACLQPWWCARSLFDYTSQSWSSLGSALAHHSTVQKHAHRCTCSISQQKWEGNMTEHDLKWWICCFDYWFSSTFIAHGI